MALLTNKLRAFSLVEVLVAMVIIMIVFGLGITITTNVFASNGMERQIQARLALDGYIAQTIQAGQYQDGSFSLPPYTLQRTIAAHPTAKGLVRLTFTIAGDNETVLLTEEKWIWLP